jgi:DNA mismatch repair protein MutS2
MVATSRSKVLSSVRSSAVTIQSSNISTHSSCPNLLNSSYSIESETLTLLEWARIGQHLATFTATKLGLAAARQLLIPSTIERSQELLNQTKEIDILEQQLGTSLSFEGICDISNPLQRAHIQGILNGRELYDVATTLAGMRRMRRSIDSSEDIPTLQELVINIRTYPELEQEIYHCIDDHGDVTDRASEKLRLIRIELKNTRDRIQKLLQNILQRHSNAIHQPVITQRSDRFVIQVKVTHKETIPGVVHDVSASGSTLYIEPHAIVSLGNQLRQFQRQEQREVEIICRELSAKVAEVGEDLHLLLVVATSIDLATARYRYSNWLGANPPRLVTIEQSSPAGKRQQITLRQLRHPLLVWQQQHEQGGNVVPTDLVIQPHTQVVTITGPNTGGKTVTLKTLAIAALMAKVGLYVAAKEPVEIPWFDQVLADIGDEQSLQQSLSTFSSHIRRIGHILAEISPNSLVLLDEVGAGTDPAEGSALARALLQYLADRAYLTIATTHYGELKALKYEDPRFENASVEFDDVSLSPTYRLLWGIPGRSNALSIARRLGLNEEVIVAAENQVSLAGGGEVNEIIAGLEAQRRLQEEKAQAAAELLQQAEAFYLEVSQKAAELQAREQQLKINQDQSIQAEIDTAKAEIAKTIRQLQKGTPTGKDAQQATAALNRIIQERSAPPPPPPIGYQPKVGERIRVPRLGQTAEVLTAADDRGNVQVRLGLMSVSVALTDVESLTGEKPKVPPKATKTFQPPAVPKKDTILIRTSNNTVDVRGQRVDAAVIAVDRAMNAAHASGILWVIHGKGTGKLREGIHDFLSSHGQVTKVELASNADGGAGVSIVHLR